MRRDQLEHAIRTACQIIGCSEVIVVGSQSILGSFREEELPASATMSIEVGILPIADSNDETARLADLIDGVDRETSVLPRGWRDRLIRVQNANTTAPGGEPQFTGWCLDKEDLCVAKLCAYREKDLEFVAALAVGGFVDSGEILRRIPTVEDRHLPASRRAEAWLRAWSSR